MIAVTEEAVKLRRFSSAVNEVAEKQVEEIISEARKIHDEKVAEAERQGEQLMEKKVRTGSAVIKNKYVRITAAEELESKRRLLRHREALADKVFENIAGKLAAFRKSPEYKDYLLKLADEVRPQLKDGGVICLSPEDKIYEAAILERLGSGFSAQTRKSIKMGGLCAVSANGSTMLDKTIDCAFQDQQELFRKDPALKLI